MGGGAVPASSGSAAPEHMVQQAAGVGSGDPVTATPSHQASSLVCFPSLQVLWLLFYFHSGNTTEALRGGDVLCSVRFRVEHSIPNVNRYHIKKL